LCLGFAVEAAALALHSASCAQPAAAVTARVLSNNPASVRVLERLGLDLLWRGTSSDAPSAADDTTLLVRLVFADRPVDEDTLRAVIALG
jgi:RimJ/RimL family protein N-acetyltransferase